MGKLIVIEGLDGCGKSTQLERLYRRLVSDGVVCRQVSFPNYESKACEPVKMYLNGDFGKDVNSVNAYAASVFYAVDRYASFKTDWGEAYNNGEVLVCGRYVTSNNIHQCSKLPETEWNNFADWLYDFEYNKMGLPTPDCVIFLSMPTEFSDRLLNERYEGDETKKDIHESDTEYLAKCRKAAVFTAEYSNWEIIPCSENGEARTIEAIAEDVLNSVLKVYED